MEIINELFLTAIGYHMVLLTGYVVRPEQKIEIGKILLYLVWIKLTYNCIVLILGLMKPIKHKFRLMKRKAYIMKSLREAEVDRFKKWRKIKKKAKKVKQKQM